MASPLTPTPKIATAGATGLASGLLVFLVKSVFKVDMPEEIAIAIVGVGTWLGGYLKRDKSSPIVVGAPVPAPETVPAKPQNLPPRPRP